MAERRRRDDGPLPIGDAIARLAGRFSRRDLLGLGAIQEGWAEVVGDQIAGHARPLSLVDGRLTVAVDQPAWATQLKLHAERLRAPLAELGSCQIDVIEVVVRAP